MKLPGVTLATHNIQDGRTSRLVPVCRTSKAQHIDIAVLTKLRIPESNPIHAHRCSDRNIFATHTTTDNQGGLALVHRDSRIWTLNQQKDTAQTSLAAHSHLEHKGLPQSALAHLQTHLQTSPILSPHFNIFLTAIPLFWGIQTWISKISPPAEPLRSWSSLQHGDRRISFSISDSRNHSCTARPGIKNEKIETP